MPQQGDSAASLERALKTTWPQTRITKRAYERNPLVALMPKAPFKGRQMDIAARIGGQQGRSADFSKALANRTSTSNIAFNIRTAKDYAIGEIDGEMADAAEGSEGSLIDGMDEVMETSFDAMDRSLAVAMFGDGSGSIGQVLSVAGNIITLVNPYDGVNFEIGQVLRANPNKTGNAGTLRASAPSVMAVNIDGAASTVTVSAIGLIVAGDWLYIDGDYDAKMKGLSAWLPATSPTPGENFFGVDRSVYPSRLAGQRYTAAGQPEDETLFKALARFATFGCRPDLVVVHPMRYQALKQSIMSRAVIDLAKSPDSPTIGFESVAIIQGNKRVKVIEDNGCGFNDGYALTLSTWKLYSRGPVPKILGKDGMKVRASTTDDSYIWRLGYYAQIACTDPGANGRILFA